MPKGTQKLGTSQRQAAMQSVPPVERSSSPAEIAAQLRQSKAAIDEARQRVARLHDQLIVAKANEKRIVEVLEGLGFAGTIEEIAAQIDDQLAELNSDAGDWRDRVKELEDDLASLGD